MVTGFARPELVKRALRAGAWDYLQKDRLIEDLLPQKVRQAAEIATTRRLARTVVVDLDGSLRAAWRETQQATDRHQKGRLLEQTIRLLLHSIPDLVYIRSNWRTSSEEFDLVVRNDSTDPFLSKEGSLWLTECKNWSRPADRSEFDAFEAKLVARSKRARLGLFIAPGGVTSGFRERQIENRREELLIVVIDQEALASWVDTLDRLEWLKEQITKAAMS